MLIGKHVTVVEWLDNTVTVYRDIHPDIFTHLHEGDGIDRIYCMTNEALGDVLKSHFINPSVLRSNRRMDELTLR